MIQRMFLTLFLTFLIAGSAVADCTPSKTTICSSAPVVMNPEILKRVVAASIQKAQETVVDAVRNQTELAVSTSTRQPQQMPAAPRPQAVGNPNNRGTGIKPRLVQQVRRFQPIEHGLYRGIVFRGAHARALDMRGVNQRNVNGRGFLWR